MDSAPWIKASCFRGAEIILRAGLASRLDFAGRFRCSSAIAHGETVTSAKDYGCTVKYENLINDKTEVGLASLLVKFDVNWCVAVRVSLGGCCLYLAHGVGMAWCGQYAQL